MIGCMHGDILGTSEGGNKLEVAMWDPSFGTAQFAEIVSARGGLKSLALTPHMVSKDAEEGNNK